MPSLDSGEPGGTLQTFFHDTVPAGSSVKSATSMSVQPAAAAAAAAIVHSLSMACQQQYRRHPATASCHACKKQLAFSLLHERFHKRKHVCCASGQLAPLPKAAAGAKLCRTLLCHPTPSLTFNVVAAPQDVPVLSHQCAAVACTRRGCWAVQVRLGPHATLQVQLPQVVEAAGNGATCAHKVKRQQRSRSC
jgi:hypothetical protein